MCYICSVALYSADTWTLQKVGKFRNVNLKKDGVDQLGRSIVNNEGGEENTTYNKKKEV
jgi:hypothetical protein